HISVQGGRGTMVW
nr:immunoglobulin heavy chain junction region [Mus musculus]